MSEMRPNEIWDQSLDEGDRRLERRPRALLATGLLGGADVMLGLIAVAVTAGALHEVLPTDLSHVLGSLTFGLAFAFITIARSELFTENFLVPVGAVFAGRQPVRVLLRMWGVTFAGNLLALTAFAALFSVPDVLLPATREAAVTLGEEVGRREVLPGFLSAIAAGAAMTLFTWVVLAAQSNSARIMLAMLMGFLLVAPKLNHAVVSFGEIVHALFIGTDAIGWDDLFLNLAVATVGNLVGGIGFSTLTRIVQVSGETGED